MILIYRFLSVSVSLSRDPETLPVIFENYNETVCDIMNRLSLHLFEM